MKQSQCATSSEYKFKDQIEKSVEIKLRSITKFRD